MTVGAPTPQEKQTSLTVDTWS